MEDTTKTRPQGVEPASLRFDERRGDDLRRLIVIPLLQNVIGGMATGALVAIIGWLFGMDWQLTAQVAGIAATCLFCLATIIRFFADDFGLLHLMWTQGWNAAAAEWEAEVAQCKQTLADAQASHASDLLVAEQRIRDAQRPIVVNRKAHDTMVAPAARDAHWQDAHRMLLLAEDGGYLPGRETMGLSWEAQAAALDVLHRTGCTLVVGKRTRLTCSVNDAYMALARLVENADKQASHEVQA
jgi:hypothetical protein